MDRHPEALAAYTIQQLVEFFRAGVSTSRSYIKEVTEAGQEQADVAQAEIARRGHAVLVQLLTAEEAAATRLTWALTGNTQLAGGTLAELTAALHDTVVAVDATAVRLPATGPDPLVLQAGTLAAQAVGVATDSAGTLRRLAVAELHRKR